MKVGWMNLKMQKKSFYVLDPTKSVKLKIDSRNRSFCLRQYVQNSLSFSGKETRQTLCTYK